MTSPVIHNCLDVIKPRGTHLEIAVFGKPIELNMDRFFNKEVNYVPTNSTATLSWKIGLFLLEQERINLRPLISREPPLSKSP